MEAAEREAPLEIPNPTEQAKLDHATITSAGRYVVCRLGAKRLAVAVDHVLEVRPMPRCARMPGVADFVRGVANVRGEATYVIDLGELLALESDGDRANERMLLVKPPGQQQAVGLAVDAVLDFALLTGAEVAGDDEGGELAGFLCEVCRFEGEPLRVLDVEGLLGSGVIGEWAEGPRD